MAMMLQRSAGEVPGQRSCRNGRNDLVLEDDGDDRVARAAIDVTLRLADLKEVQGTGTPCMRRELNRDYECKDGRRAK